MFLSRQTDLQQTLPLPRRPKLTRVKPRIFHLRLLRPLLQSYRLRKQPYQQANFLGRLPNLLCYGFPENITRGLQLPDPRLQSTILGRKSKIAKTLFSELLTTRTNLLLNLGKHLRFPSMAIAKNCHLALAQTCQKSFYQALPKPTMR